MALNPISTPAFESEEDATPTTTAVATAPKTAVSVFDAVADTVGSLKNKLTVSYNSFIQIIASNGNFLERESKTNLGDTLRFELISWQDSYVVQPGSDKAGKELVKFSDDRIVCSDGTLVIDHLNALKAMGYDKASIKDRIVVVGSVLSTAKAGEKLVDELVQIDLSPMSAARFVRFRGKALNLQRLGKRSAEEVTKVAATTEIATAGSNSYTVINFDIDKAA